MPVLIIPGFLSSDEEYEGMADALRRFDASADVFVVPLETKDWYPTLLGGDFRAILDKVDRAATEALRASGSPPEGKTLRVVGHSAGGWLARTWLGSSPYMGRVYGGAKKTRVLLTLGTPHYSLERYPFGRVSEKLFADAEARADFEREAVFSQRKRLDDDDDEDARAESPWTASRAAESTLALTNFRTPARSRRACGTSPCAAEGWSARPRGGGSPSRCVLPKNVLPTETKRRETQTRAFARPPRSRRWARASRTRRAAGRATAWTATA